MLANLVEKLEEKLMDKLLMLSHQTVQLERLFTAILQENSEVPLALRR